MRRFYLGKKSADKWEVLKRFYDEQKARRAMADAWASEPGAYAFVLLFIDGDGPPQFLDSVGRFCKHSTLRPDDTARRQN